MGWKKVQKVCLACGREFMAIPTRKFCSPACSQRMHPGRPPRHGYAGTREHATWLDMRNRCRNPDAHNYARYGGRGIKVCARWDAFENFLADMGPKPGAGYSIERCDNDGDYDPGNCKWATATEQSRNRSISYTPELDQKIRDAAGRGLTFPEIGKLIGKSHSSVTARAFRLKIPSGRWKEKSDYTTESKS